MSSQTISSTRSSASQPNGCEHGKDQKAMCRVGEEGELFPPKEVREEAGLMPGDHVV